MAIIIYLVTVLMERTTRAAALIWELAQMDFLTVPAARHLYEKFGFALSYQQPGT